MTEPIDGSETASDQEATTPTTAPSEPAGAAPTASPGTPPDDPSPGWVTPTSAADGGSQRRGCVIALLVVAVLVLALLLSLIFLGAEEVSRRAGTFEFGTGGTDCSVTGAGTSFPSSTSIRVVAFLEREVADGETITVVLTDPDGRTETADFVWKQAGQCDWEDLPPGFPPGHFVVEYRAGTEVLAKGAFDITP